MIQRRAFIALAGAAPAALAFAPAALAASPEIFATNGIAINGYDPVAYFTRSEPAEGSDQHTFAWKDATWRFASAEHRDMFGADPDAYAPRYGGYCAYAVSKGATATTVPEAWTVYNDRLYLNFSTGVRSLWQQDIPGNIARADDNWPGVLN